MVVLVLSSASPWIGVDVEVENRAVAIDELAAMVCAPSERAWLDSIDPGDRRAAFFASWTLKEAYLKAIGLGLQRDPARQVFDLSAGTVARSLDLVAGAALADWRFGRWAVATRRPPCRRRARCGPADAGRGDRRLLARPNCLRGGGPSLTAPHAD